MGPLALAQYRTWVVICAGCGQENPDGFRLCGMCGASLLAESPSRRDVRKTVTVVFSDVSGSTALGERLDPESLRRVMSSYFDAMRSVLERHGGTVEKFIGDAVMAVFGIPTLHEDDALRAVRAAHEMRLRLTVLNEDLERSWGVTIASRTGVDTGEVLAGDPTRGESFATGDAVNVAARLEQAARPGEILIGTDTYRLVRDAVEVQEHVPLTLKGKQEEVAALSLLDVLPEAAGRSRRPDSVLVGRERELKLLANAYERAIHDRACQLFTIMGAAGVGKSRLVAEFLKNLSSDATVARGRCLPYGEGITYWPLAEALKTLVGLDESAPRADARRQLGALLEGEESAELIVDRVLELIGLSNGTSVREEGFWAVRRLLEASARRKPLVLVVDDIQWGEDTFLDLVEHIADWSRDAPVLLLCVARPELFDVRRGWGGDKFNATSVLLEPLSERECEQLIANMLGEAELAREVGARIADAAEGNPLFVEEMLAMLIDEGLLTQQNGHWLPTIDLNEISMPATIQALLSARLDRLQIEERAVLEYGSIEGKHFHRGAVVELAAEGLRPRVETQLMVLVRKELIRSDEASLAGEDGFRFRHLLVRDAAYDSIPKQVRAELHERYALWLEQKVGERSAEYEEILGYHLEQAFRYRSELSPLDPSAQTLGRQAAAWLTSAAGRAEARGDARAAAKLLERAIALLGAGPTQLELLIELGSALASAGELARADTLLSSAIDAAETAEDPRLAAHACVLRLTVRVQTDPTRAIAASRNELERVIPIFEDAEDERGLYRSWHLLGGIQWHACQAEKAGEAWAQALHHARVGNDQGGVSNCLPLLSAAAFNGPTPAGEVVHRCEELLEQVRGSPLAEARIRTARAASLAMLGRFDEARADVERAHAIADELGWPGSNLTDRHRATEVELLANSPEAAERHARAGYKQLTERGEKSNRSTTAVVLAEALLCQGKHEEAEQFLRISKQLSGEGDITNEVQSRSVEARLLAKRGRLDEADRLAREGVKLARSTDFINIHADALMSLGEALHVGDRPGEALPVVDQALRLYEQKQNLISAKKAQALFEQLERTTSGLGQVPAPPRRS